MEKFNEIDESQYKVDFEITDSYIAFSSELLRLSLLAMGGFGALTLLKIKREAVPTFLQNPQLFLTSMTLFALCAGSTLFHRYFASDCKSWYIAWLRAEIAVQTEKVTKQKTGFHRNLKISGRFLILSEIFFGGGVLFFVIAIFKLFL